MSNEISEKLEFIKSKMTLEQMTDDVTRAFDYVDYCTRQNSINFSELEKKIEAAEDDLRKAKAEIKALTIKNKSLLEAHHEGANQWADISEAPKANDCDNFEIAAFDNYHSCRVFHDCVWRGDLGWYSRHSSEYIKGHIRYKNPLLFRFEQPQPKRPEKEAA